MKLPKEFTLAEIAHVIGGKVSGPADTKVSTVAMTPATARAGDLALVFDSKLLKQLSACQASAVIIPEGETCHLPAVSVARPMLALQKMLSAVSPRRFHAEAGIHPSAVVDKSCEIGEGVAIGPLVVVGPGSKIGAGTKIAAGCVIGGQVSIGENCLFHAGCLIADYVQIGNRVVLQQGASIGSDGFGYVTERTSNLERRLAGDKNLSNESNPHLKIPQIGNVIIEDDVEIGSNATIARATMGATIIGAGSKLDNLVMIAHNCRIGKETIIVSQSGLAGSTSLGDRAIVAGQVGVKDHIRIGADAILEAQSGVMRDVGEGEVVCGSPAVPHMEFMTNVAMTRKGEQIYKEVRDLKKKVAQLESLLLERQLVGKDN